MTERVINNTTLSNFSRVNRLDILRQLFGKVYITYEVREEVLRGIEEGYTFLENAAVQIRVGIDAWLELVGFENPREEQSFREYILTLGYGEASCLTLARHRGWLVVTDDRAARQRLRHEGHGFTGTLGVLKLAVEHALITLEEGDALLQEMIRVGYRSPYDRLEDIEE